MLGVILSTSQIFSHLTFLAGLQGTYFFFYQFHLAGMETESAYCPSFKKMTVSMIPEYKGYSSYKCCTFIWFLIHEWIAFHD